MRKERRLRKSKDFAEVRRFGQSWADSILVVAARRNGGPHTRFGFAVGRRVGNAVTRNRVKRRLRAAASCACVAEGWDLVVIARNRAAGSDYLTLMKSLFNLLRRAKIDGLGKDEP